MEGHYQAMVGELIFPREVCFEKHICFLALFYLQTSNCLIHRISELSAGGLYMLLMCFSVLLSFWNIVINYFG